MPEFPKLPKIDKNPITTASRFIEGTVSGIQKAVSDIDNAVKDIDSKVSAPHGIERPPIDEIASATACLSCTRDHFSTISGALAEALRFARDEGMDNKDVQGRIGLALDEHNAMERIDLAAEAITKLTGKEKELAEWSLKKSRELRHMVGEIETVNDLEKAAAKAANVRREFTSLYSGTKQTYAEECTGCEALADLGDFLEKRKKS